MNKSNRIRNKRTVSSGCVRRGSRCSMASVWCHLTRDWTRTSCMAHLVRDWTRTSCMAHLASCFPRGEKPSLLWSRSAQWWLKPWAQDSTGYTDRLTLVPQYKKTPILYINIFCLLKYRHTQVVYPQMCAITRRALCMGFELRSPHNSIKISPLAFSSCITLKT